MEESKLSKSSMIRILQDAEDKFSIFADRNILVNCNFDIPELIDLINEFLTDEQKAKLFTLEHFRKLPTNTKSQIVNTISDDNSKRELLENDDFVAGLADYEIEEIAKTLDDNNKIQLLNNHKVLQKVGAFRIINIAKSLTEKKKIEILLNKGFVNLGVPESGIIYIVASLEDEETKTKMIELYQFIKYDKLIILGTFSDESKVKILLENEYGLDNDELEILASNLSTNGLVDFFKENEEFFTKNGINKYDITRRLIKKEQLEFISHLDDIGLSLVEKRQILATLKDETKEAIDTSNFPPEYMTALRIKHFGGKIIIDLNEDLEIYRDLGEMIEINGMQLSNEERKKLHKLVEICPQATIKNDTLLGTSTVEEYKEAETWIETVLQGIDQSWTDIQKIAFIDNAIGKKISYSPDFGTEVFDEGDARAVWKIISSGEGVCNGIAQVEQYILKLVGIEAERVSGVRHSFLRLKNIEMPNADGSTSVGDTIIDPTWNLSAHRYGGFPENFCKSYEEIRKNDIDDDKNDCECHKNDEELSDVTLNLDEQSLRRIFASIGVANRDGTFPIGDFIDKSNIIDAFNFQEEDAIKAQLLLFARCYPDFATCNNSTAKTLKAISLDHKNLKFNRSVVDRVYEREDKSKRPVLYVYVDFPNAGKKFYFADKESGAFLELPQKEFEARFECYENDMEKQGGHRPWEDIEQARVSENLAQSSGRVVAMEGEEK